MAPKDVTMIAPVCATEVSFFLIVKQIHRGENKDIESATFQDISNSKIRSIQKNYRTNLIDQFRHGGNCRQQNNNPSHFSTTHHNDHHINVFRKLQTRCYTYCCCKHKPDTI